MRFIDLAAQQDTIRPELDRRIKTVLDHGEYIMGPEVGELEKKLADFAGAKHCVTCSSGTDALLMALMAWNVGPGDGVFVPAFTFFATAEVVALLGATPVLVDIDPATFNMDPRALAKAIEAVRARDASAYPLPATAGSSIDSPAKALTPRAVIPVDLFGQAADYAALLSVAGRHGLLVLEDAAQSFGARQGTKRTCNLGCHMAATSFFPAKPLGCYGDGGAVFTDNEDWADGLRSIRVHGKGGDKYDNIRIGLTARLDTIQAAVLLCKLEIFEEELEARVKVAGWYAERLADIDGITAPGLATGNTSAWAQYCVRVAGGRRDAVALALKKLGIPTNIYYPRPLTMLRALEHLGYRPQDMPQALAASREALALPFHPYMSEADVAKVAAGVREGLL